MLVILITLIYRLKFCFNYLFLVQTVPENEPDDPVRDSQPEELEAHSSGHFDNQEPVQQVNESNGNQPMKSLMVMHRGGLSLLILCD
jgi:hypothetical protein